MLQMALSFWVVGLLMPIAALGTPEGADNLPAKFTYYLPHFNQASFFDDREEEGCNMIIQGPKDESLVCCCHDIALKGRLGTHGGHILF